MTFAYFCFRTFYEDSSIEDRCNCIVHIYLSSSFVLQEMWGPGGQDTKKKHFFFSAISLSLHSKALSQCEQLGMEEHRAGGLREGRGGSGSIGLGSPAV